MESVLYLILPFVFRILDLSYQLEHLFLGCSKSEQASIIQMRIRGWSLEFLVQMRGKQNNSASKQGATQGICQQYLNKLSLIKRYTHKDTQIICKPWISNSNECLIQSVFHQYFFFKTLCPMQRNSSKFDYCNFGVL